MAYSGKAVANELLELAHQSRQQLTNMKLQKLLFFAHGWHLAQFGKPLLKDRVEAWKYGPVVSDVYHSVKDFGDAPIRGKLLRWYGLEQKAPRIPQDDNRTREFLREIWNTYKDFTAVQLSNMTHLPNSPWDIAWHQKGGKFRNSQDIDEEDILDYFARQRSEGLASEF